MPCRSSWIGRARHRERGGGDRAVAETLLLVDDDSDVLRAVGDYFERLGYEVAREGTGEEGVATFLRLRPEVVLLDLHLPDVGGLEVRERLRPQGASVTLLSGQGETNTAERAMQLPAEQSHTSPQ